MLGKVYNSRPIDVYLNKKNPPVLHADNDDLRRGHTYEPLAAALAALAGVSPPQGLVPLEEKSGDEGWWERLAADPAPFLGLGIVTPAWLERALDERLHVLCEKPLVWGVENAADRHFGERLLRRDEHFPQAIETSQPAVDQPDCSQHRHRRKVLDRTYSLYRRKPRTY